MSQQFLSKLRSGVGSLVLVLLSLLSPRHALLIGPNLALAVHKKEEDGGEVTELHHM